MLAKGEEKESDVNELHTYMYLPFEITNDYEITGVCSELQIQWTNKIVMKKIKSLTYFSLNLMFQKG